MKLAGRIFATVFSFFFSAVAVYVILGVIGSQMIPSSAAWYWICFVGIIAISAGYISAKRAWAGAGRASSNDRK
jgi:hypothetical protein